jgi:broad specificity phosphatase PhoE
MDKPLRFYFARHGETQWNHLHKIQGSTEVPLDSRGHQQARDAVGVLKRIGSQISCIVTSPQGRAQATATILSMAFPGNIPVIVEHDLREREFGPYEGTSMAELHGVPVWPDQPREAMNFPGYAGIENFEDVIKRTEKTVLPYLGGDRKKGYPFFVAHGGIGKALLKVFGCAAIHIDNAIPYIFEQQVDNQWTCRPV